MKSADAEDTRGSADRIFGKGARGGTKGRLGGSGTAVMGASPRRRASPRCGLTHRSHTERPREVAHPGHGPHFHAHPIRQVRRLPGDLRRLVQVGGGQEEVAADQLLRLRERPIPPARSSRARDHPPARQERVPALQLPLSRQRVAPRVPVAEALAPLVVRHRLITLRCRLPEDQHVRGGVAILHGTPGVEGLKGNGVV